jgi:hypothetical protein
VSPEVAEGNPVDAVDRRPVRGEAEKKIPRFIDRLSKF